MLLLSFLSTPQYQKPCISPPVKLTGLPDRDTKDPAALCRAKEGWNQGEMPIFSPRNWKVAVFSFLNKWTKVEVMDLLNLVYNRYMFQRDILLWVTNLPKIIELVSRKDGIEPLATWFLSSSVWILISLLLYIIIDAKHSPETLAAHGLYWSIISFDT